MSQITIEYEELLSIIREETQKAVRIALDEEINLRRISQLLSQTTVISDAEQREIENQAGEPNGQIDRILTVER